MADLKVDKVEKKPFIVSLEKFTGSIESNLPRYVTALVGLVAIFVSILCTSFIPLTAGNEIDSHGTVGAGILLWGGTILLTMASISIPASVNIGMQDGKWSYGEIFRTLILAAFAWFIIRFLIGPKLYTIYIVANGLQEYFNGFDLSLLLQGIKSGISSNFRSADLIQSQDSVEIQAIIDEARNNGIIYISSVQFDKIIAFEQCCMAMGIDVIWNLLITFLGLSRLEVMKKQAIGKQTPNGKINQKVGEMFDNSLKWLDILFEVSHNIDLATVASNLRPSTIVFEKLKNEENKMALFSQKIDKFISSRLITDAGVTLELSKANKDELIKATNKNTNIPNSVNALISGINKDFAVNIKK